MDLNSTGGVHLLQETAITSSDYYTVVPKHRDDMRVFCLYVSSFVFDLRCCCHGALRLCMSKGTIFVSGMHLV